MVCGMERKGGNLGRVLSYSGTSLIRNSTPLGPYNRTMPRALRWPYGGPRGAGQFLMSEVPLYQYQ